MVSQVLAQAILGQAQADPLDVLGAFRKGQDITRGIQAKTLAGQALQGGEAGAEAFKELQGLDPEVALQIGEKIQARDAQSVNDFIRDAKIGQNLLASGNTQGFLNFADQRSQIIRNAGGDSQQTDRIADLVRAGNIEQAQQELTAFTQSVDDTKKQGLTERQRNIRELEVQRERLERGEITQEQFEEIKRGLGIDPLRPGRTAEEEAEIVRAKQLAKQKTERGAEQIQSGLVAADSTANLRRGIELLKRLKTGGASRVAFAAKQFFGVESADEAELASNLGLAVLSQLRETFGAAFTAAEGARLEKLSQNIGKSPEGNRRILENSLRIAERAAQRGIRAAEAAGDFEQADEIRAALEFTLGEIPEGPTTATTTTSGVAPPGQPATVQQPVAQPLPQTGGGGRSGRSRRRREGGQGASRFQVTVEG